MRVSQASRTLSDAPQKQRKDHIPVDLGQSLVLD